MRSHNDPNEHPSLKPSYSYKLPQDVKDKIDQETLSQVAHLRVHKNHTQDYASPAEAKPKLDKSNANFFTKKQKNADPRLKVFDSSSK